MQSFQNVEWTPILHEESFKHNGQEHMGAYYVISDWKIPFTFQEWSKELGLEPKTPPEHIYTFCAQRLTRPFCKRMVAEAQTRLECDPGFVSPAEKMASFYILKLLAVTAKHKAWELWDKVPKTEALLKDEVFCLAVVALHPVLYGKLHPIGRNNRRVCLEAIAKWDLPKYSLLQFAHPYALRTFQGKNIHPNVIGLHLQHHTDAETHYWIFDDYSVITRAIGKPGSRRWFEMEFVGPTAAMKIVQERNKHNNSIESLKPFLEKNKYVNSF